MMSAVSQRKDLSLAVRVRLRLEEFVRLFNLDRIEADIVLVCLTSEIDSRYEKLFAFLQDDVTKKRPSVDLVLNLLSTSLNDKIESRRHFGSGAPLIDYRLIELFADPSQPEPTLVRKYCKLDERVVNFLLGGDALDNRLQGFTFLRRAESCLETMLMPAELRIRLLAAANMATENARRATFYFQGASGAGKQSTAEALCRERDLPLLVVETKQLLEGPEPGFKMGVQLALREAMLQGAAIYWRGIDCLLAQDGTPALNFLLCQLEAMPALSFLAGETTWEPGSGQLAANTFIRIQFPSPNEAERLALWGRLLDTAPRAADIDLTILSNQFRLNAGSIEAAVRTAQNLACWRDPRSGQLTMADLYAACRLQSNRKLATLARKVEPHYDLDDIVLPADQLAQLTELLAQAKHRHIVYGQWGFDRKSSMGRGLCALFSGASGTGKTMAAEVIANELGLDLYKIDLSQIVSKYIGETEKNLDQIFREAHLSNAILFFDEADALFGKRSEVKDAHDRYANIEVGYLLQKMEEYEGIAVLATNLRQNMDEAFVRRMHVIIEFPFPDEEFRRRIWRVAFPPQAPLGEEINFDLLARDIRLPGGNIKNIAVAAAFHAAGDGRVIRMAHLLEAARREHQKLGRTWTEAERNLQTRKTGC
jgi:ATP-dependent 26S proteasome regulatory subunit